MLFFCFALKNCERHEMNNDSDTFSCILIGWIVMLLRECYAWFRVGYVNMTNLHVYETKAVCFLDKG